VEVEVEVEVEVVEGVVVAGQSKSELTEGSRGAG